MSGEVLGKPPINPDAAEARDTLEKKFGTALKDAESLLYYAASCGKLPIKGDPEKEEDKIVSDIVNSREAWQKVK